LKLEREGYNGGRNECFYIGTLNSQKYYKLDVNSMYPYVMQNNKYPVELLGYGEKVNIERLIDLIEKILCNCKGKT